MSDLERAVAALQASDPLIILVKMFEVTSLRVGVLHPRAWTLIKHVQPSARSASLSETGAEVDGLQQ